MMALANSPYRVVLAHGPNPDIRSGYWSDPVDSGRATHVPCGSLQEASRLCRAFIQANGLGAGNWSGGAVYEKGADGRWFNVARISYNGRIWGLDGTEILPA